MENIDQKWKELLKLKLVIQQKEIRLEKVKEQHQKLQFEIRSTAQDIYTLRDKLMSMIK